MNEEMRNILVQFCNTHNSEMSRRLEKLLDLTDDVIMEAVVLSEPTDEDSLFLDTAIEEAEDPKLREALEELNEFLFYD